MPPKSKKALANASNASKRWKKDEIRIDDTFSISEENECNNACQTQSKRFRSIGTNIL